MNVGILSKLPQMYSTIPDLRVEVVLIIRAETGGGY